MVAEIAPHLDTFRVPPRCQIMLGWLHVDRLWHGRGSSHAQRSLRAYAPKA
jgi:hypothetical protein